MEKLPVECRMNILKHLNLPQQISIYKSSPCCQHALRLLWQAKFEFKHLAFDFYEHLAFEDFSLLLSNIHMKVQGICFHYDEYSATFAVMTTYEFPQLHDALIAINDFEDSKLLTLVKMFPNVEKLRLRGMGNRNKIDLLRLKAFSSLKILILDNCSFTQYQFYQLIKNSAISTIELGSISVKGRLTAFGEENISSLKEISLNATNLEILTTGLLQHLNLRSIAILSYFRAPELAKRACELLTACSPTTEIEVQGIPDASICDFPNLRQINFKKLVFGYIVKRPTICSILKALPVVKPLSEITFWWCNMDDEALIEFLIDSPVDKLNIISCVFNTPTLRIDGQYIEAKRSKLLTIRHIGDLELIGETKMLDVKHY